MDAPGSVAASTAGGSAISSSDAETVEKYVTQLDIAGMLGGQNLGHLLGNAQRALGPMRRKDPTSPAVLQISSHIELFKSAEKMRAPHIYKLAKQEREKILGELALAQVKWSGTAALTLLCCHVREEKADASKLVGLMLPVQAGSDGSETLFDPLSPRLSAANMTDPERARALHRLGCQRLSRRQHSPR